MTDPRAFVSAMVEESLGLIRGTADESMITQDLVDEVSSVLRGGHPDGFPLPSVEEKMRAVLATARRDAIARDGCFLRKARWPRGASVAVCLTHDVDNIARPRGHLWKTRSRFAPGELVEGLLGVGNPYENILLIASKEREQGFRSSFYFMTSNYPLGPLKAEAASLRGHGWEVGMHGDFGTHDSFEKMKEAVSRFADSLGFRPTGLREHYLKFDFSKSWKVMNDAGFDYDTTVGNNDRIGFKLGLASPFHPPDEAWNPMPLLEVPLVLMDTTLWGYLKRTEDEGFFDFLAVFEAVEKVEGLLTLLWHQEAVKMKGGRIYWRILKELRRRGCYVGSGAQVSRWWRDRAVPLVRDRKLIRLDGPAPRDLALELSVSEDSSPVVRSGVIQARRDGFIVRPTARDFRLELA